MKKKITLQLSDEILDRLKSATDERCVNRAILVEKALERFLREPVDSGAPSQDRLGSLEQQLEGIQRDLKALNDTVGLHARYHLALTSLGRDGATQGSADRRLSEAPATRRAEGEVRERITEDCSSEHDDEPLPFGAPTCRVSNSRTAVPITEVSWGVPAAREGGEDPFRLAEGSLR
ncbi:CopG family transcriptional regulator [Bradyrhizobium sp. STM 3809]|uniref:ribbon-helix-helix domain-containing protein n=1 Tax=Bradyrhizobium sp. STM 3809 TaxID=551936 RepID=UPI0005525374|nr:CopG family transcriptional regulator [Bradyrhizobium sp. STM 3809]